MHQHLYRKVVPIQSSNTFLSTKRRICVIGRSNQSIDRCSIASCRQVDKPRRLYHSSTAKGISIAMRQSSSVVRALAVTILSTSNTLFGRSCCNAWIHPTTQYRGCSVSSSVAGRWPKSIITKLKQNKGQRMHMTAAANIEAAPSSDSTKSTTVLVDDNIQSSTNNGDDGSTVSNNFKIAEGTILEQYPGGFTAVRINDESTVLLDPAMINPLVVGAEAASISSSKGKNSGVKLTSMDYQGKQVIYPNGATGVVIAHRPPLIFCYSDDEISMANADDANKSENNVVQVMNDMLNLSISPNGRRFDCFGNSLLHTAEANSSDNDKTDSGNKRQLSDRMIFGPIPKVSEIALINNPMITGNTMIDTLAPIGRGQNMLLIGSDVDEMRAIGRDFLATQIETSGATSSSSSLPTVCVYASTEMDQTMAYQRIKDSGIADHVHYVGPTKTRLTNNVGGKSDMSYYAESVMVVNTAIAIAESYALYENRHTVVVIDTIDLYKSFHDVTTRILVDTFGIQSVVQQDPNSGGTSSSEMRSFYSAFIQRAGQYNKKMGGGSVTLLLLTTIPPTDDSATSSDQEQIFTIKDFELCSEAIKNRIKILDQKGIPLSAATLKKINIPLPTVSEYDRRLQLQHIDELISMSDGQIWLDDSLGRKNMKPTMDPQRSITRIGVGADTQSRADAPAIRRIAEGIRLELIQSSISSMTGAVDRTNIATQNQLRRERSLLYAMYQPPGMVPIRRLSESCIVLLAARQGYLNPFVTDNDASVVDPSSTDTGEYSIIRNLLQHIKHESSDEVKQVLNEIDTTQDITDSSKMHLLQAIAEFFSNHVQ